MVLEIVINVARPTLICDEKKTGNALRRENHSKIRIIFMQRKIIYPT